MIPMYRVEPYIKNVVESLPEWVSLIIAVDDASPDRSEEVVLELHDPRIILICHEENQGVGGAC